MEDAQCKHTLAFTRPTALDYAELFLCGVIKRNNRAVRLHDRTASAEQDVWSTLGEHPRLAALFADIAIDHIVGLDDRKHPLVLGVERDFK